jgi:hypothetical protein
MSWCIDSRSFTTTRASATVAPGYSEVSTATPTSGRATRYTAKPRVCEMRAARISGLVA